MRQWMILLLLLLFIAGATLTVLGLRYMDFSAATFNSATFPINSRQNYGEVMDWLAASPSLTIKDRRLVLLQRLAEHPQGMNNALKALDDEKDPDDALNIAGDIQIISSLQRALSIADNTDLANQLVDAISQRKASIKISLSKMLEQVNKGVSEHHSNPKEVFSDSALSTKINQLIILAQLIDENSTIGHDVVRNLIHQAVDMSTHQAAEYSTFLNNLDQQIKEGVKFEPASNRKDGSMAAQDGQCELRLKELKAYAQMLDDDRFHRWSDVVTGAASPTDNELGKSLDKALQELRSKAEQISTDQLLLYNVWALRMIYAAEEADPDNWSISLGCVNRSLLHPSVLSLWNQAHDKGLEKIKDREIRPAIVKNLMTVKPILLNQF